MNAGTSAGSASQATASRDTRVGHCKKDDTDVYAGRGSGGRDMTNTPIGVRGWLGNPFALSDGYSRDESVEKFKEVFLNRIHNDREFADAIADLHGQTLGCWCQRTDDNEPRCHARVIAETVDAIVAARCPE